MNCLRGIEDAVSSSALNVKWVITQEKRMKTNFLGETIPDYIKLQQGMDIAVILNEAKYSFSDFYETKWVKGREEYSLRSTVNPEFKNVQGLYILFDKENPVYAGISGNVVNRIKQHFNGKSHYSASLVYLMAKEEYRTETNKEYKGVRAEFDFEKYRSNIQREMKKSWRFSIIPVEDCYKLHLMEFFFACELKTFWNSFKTH